MYSLIYTRVRCCRTDPGQTELLDEFTSPRSECETDVQEDIVGIRGATFTWSEDGTTEQQNDSDTIRSFRLKISDELKFENGSVNLILGPTGSGKTALLLALLGMLVICLPRPVGHVG